MVLCLGDWSVGGREAAVEAYVFVAVEILSAVELIVAVVFWISWIESWVLAAVIWTPWSRILTFSTLS